MKKELLDALYEYKHELLQEINQIEEGQSIPFNSSEASIIAKTKLEEKNKQYNMIYNIINRCFDE